MADKKQIAENMLLELKALNSGLTDTEAMHNLLHEFMRDAVELAEKTLDDKPCADVIPTLRVPNPLHAE